MNARDAALWTWYRRKSATLAPDAQRELLRALNVLREVLDDVEVARFIASGQIDRLLDDAMLDRSFREFRKTLINAAQRGFDGTQRLLPNQGRVNGQVAVGFDILNPRVIDAVRQLDTVVVQSVKQDVREGIRAFVENGLRDGKNPRVIAREIRGIVGLGPKQAEWVVNYRARLEARGVSGIDKKVAAYANRLVRHNAETVSRTATLDALKKGQDMSWRDAIDKGIVDPANLRKQWVSVGDDRVRPEHQTMHGQTVPFGQPYSNGQMVPGETEYNCRCISRVFVAQSQSIAA